MGWYAVCRRELLLLWKKIGKLGYVFSSIMFPLIYLFAFGLGLGSRVNIEGGYLPFLIKGIVGVTVALNSFQQTALSVSVGRMYFCNFQSLILSPVSPAQVGLGIVLAGVIRGMLTGLVIFLVASVVFNNGGIGLIGISGVILAAFCFASLGLAIGMTVKDADEISIVNNFIITPMIFFGGSFFPVQNLPPWLAAAAGLFPLSMANTLLRAALWDGDVIKTAAVLLLFSGCFFAWGVCAIKRYSE